MKRPILLLLALCLAAIAVVALVVGEIIVDRAGAGYNLLIDPGPYEVSDQASAFHQGLFVADLHADSLLWSRDLRRRGNYGHVDLPRLEEGNVALQVFGLVTQVPKGQNFERNSGDTDAIGLMTAVARWPPRTWKNNFERARYQCQKLERLERSSRGELMRILKRSDLRRLVERRAAGENIVGGMLGLEGAQALNGELANLEKLFDAGLRMIGLSHFFDTPVAGSAHGVEQGGLTELGRRVVAESERLGIAIDLAHASPATRRDVLAMATRPIVVSHTGVRATCAGPRNLTDEDLAAIAATGGVVGIGFFEGATCGNDLDAILDAVEHAVRVIGADHVAMGSDFDGAVETPFDVAGMALITEGLMARGMSHGDIAKIMGSNVVRVLDQTLPD